MPKVIKRFAEVSDIDKHELYRVFNMGVGYIFVVSPEDKDNVIKAAQDFGISIADTSISAEISFGRTLGILS